MQHAAAVQLREHPRELTTHLDDRLRFEREAKLLALLDVPGLPRFFDYAPEAVPPYIAMACATGVPAARFCLASDQIRLTFVEVVEVVETVEVVEAPPFWPPKPPPPMNQCTCPEATYSWNTARVGQGSLPLKPPSDITGSPVASW